jgi:hypothetical protein
MPNTSSRIRRRARPARRRGARTAQTRQRGSEGGPPFRNLARKTVIARQRGKDQKTTEISFPHYTLDGLGIIAFPDGRSGMVWLLLNFEPGFLTSDSFISGREDIIAVAVEHGHAKLRLAADAHLRVAITPLNSRYAAIKLTSTDTTIAHGDDQEPVFDIIKLKLPSSLSLIAAGQLKIGAGWSGPVAIQTHSVDEFLPGVLEVIGDSELIDAAYHGGRTVRLEICGSTFRVPVIGQRKDTGSLLISAKSMYRAMARKLEG